MFTCIEVIILLTSKWIIDPSIYTLLNYDNIQQISQKNNNAEKIKHKFNITRKIIILTLRLFQFFGSLFWFHFMIFITVKYLYIYYFFYKNTFFTIAYFIKYK